MSDFQADQNPIFQHGAQFVFAFAQGGGKATTPLHAGLRPKNVPPSNLSYSACERGAV